MQSLTYQLRLALEPECLENLTNHRRDRPQEWNGLQRHSSCLWFQMLGVEARSFLPDDQRDGCNLAGQSQTGHFRPNPLGHQCVIKLLERSGLGSGDGRSTLEQILEDSYCIWSVALRIETGFLERCSSPWT